MTEIFTWPLPAAELSDGRLVLRTMRAEDAEDVYLCSIDERMKRYTTVAVDYSREMARDFTVGSTDTLYSRCSGRSSGSASAALSRHVSLMSRARR